MRSFRGPLLAGVVAFLAACAAIPPETLPPGSFALVGRVAVRYGDEAASGRLTWRHSGVADELLISTPLGQGVAEITRRDGVYTLIAASGERYSAADPEQLTRQVLGYALPLAGLPDWVRGRPRTGRRCGHALRWRPARRAAPARLADRLLRRRRAAAEKSAADPRRP